MISHQLSQHAAVVARTVRPVLIAVQDACEEIVAGLGSALFSVRTLDGLSCDVRAGELLLLVGGVASGATSLLDALYGPPASRARAQRRVTSGVQLRRATIPFNASEAIIAGWRDAQDSSQSAASPDVSNVTRAPVVYLLRVRPNDPTRDASIGGITPHSWRAWSGALKRCGGAVVLARGSERRVGEGEKRATAQRAFQDLAMVRESYERDDVQIRTLTLHAGRIVSAEVEA